VVAVTPSTETTMFAPPSVPPLGIVPVALVLELAERLVTARPPTVMENGTPVSPNGSAELVKVAAWVALSGPLVGELVGAVGCARYVNV